MNTVLRDLRYAIRVLLRTPCLSAVVILTIALGVGLTTHTFSIVYGSVIRGLPYPGAERLMSLRQANLAEGNNGLTVPIHDYLDWREQQTSFEDLGALHTGTVNLADPGQRPDRFLGAHVTWNTFQLAGAQPILGRGFRAGEDLPQAPATLVIGHDVWQTRYGSDPDIIGKTVRANGKVHTIIGVMPDKFKFPFDSSVWLPLAMDPVELKRGEGSRLDVFGRLKEGVTAEQAKTDLATISARLAREYPETNEGVTAEIVPYTERYMPPQITAVLWVMLVAVFGVLLIACSNVANLLLARAATRSKEISIRTALGAHRAAVIRQLLAESLVLALIGGAVGLGLAAIGIEVFNTTLVDIQKPFWIEIAVFPAVLAFAFGVTLVASLVSGTIPALKASSSDVGETLKDSGRGGSSFNLSRVSGGLVIAEVAVSCGLLIAAGFLVKSVIRISQLDMGFVTENVFTARVGLNTIDYPDESSRRQFHDGLLTRLEALPGAQKVALTSNLPVTGAGTYWYGVEAESYTKDQDYPYTNRSVITPGYFEAFGTQMIEGRDFTQQDREDGLEVAIVNTSFARRHFADSRAVGQRLRFGRSDSQQPWISIIGVVPDLHIGGGVGGIGSDDRLQEQVYLPLAQHPASFMSVVIKTTSSPLGMAPSVRAAIAGIDPNLPIYDVRSMESVIETNTWAFGMFGSLFAMFGAIALFMSAVGLYGVMAFAVHRRRQELGIRMALGAGPSKIMLLVFRKAMVQVAVGLTLGLVIGAALSQPLKVMLFDVDTNDPTVYGVIAVTLTLAALLACLVPVRRALGVDPVKVLRTE